MKTEAIQAMLNSSTVLDLAELYSYSMEVQVNVAQDNGEREEGEYLGRKWVGWTDGETTWKAMRIPWNANKIPEYNDSAMKYDLAHHAEAIGMTGWDWVNKTSKWVAYDFDSIVNHVDGITPAELDEIVKAVHNIEWVTVRRSTSGTGFHLYVFLPEVPTENHTEHAALARAILGQMSAIAGMDFQSKVDGCGGNMWVWHRKMRGTAGLQLIKQGSELEDIPCNWRDHLKVISGSRRKTLPQNLEDGGQGSLFDSLSGQRMRITLDEEHKDLMEWLRTENHLWWWDSDNQMLVTHTFVLQLAHEALSLKGTFSTSSKGLNTDEQNCFCFPMKDGVWNVRRFTPGVQEAKTWTQDGQGWTRCYLNRQADFDTACRMFEGIKDPKGSYVFFDANQASEALGLLGIHPDIDEKLKCRRTKLKMSTDKEVIIEIDKEATDTHVQMKGWLSEKNKPWTQVAQSSHRAVYEPETLNYDEVVRHLVAGVDKKDRGWSLKANAIWQEEPKGNIKDYLKSLGHKAGEADVIIGTQIARPWLVVCKPFEPEFPGNREWNRQSAQLRFVPDEEGKHPTWLSIMSRCGKGLDDAVRKHGWCRANGITTGADYLKCWVAALFQFPEHPLPYIFLFGPQNSGKSALFEAIELLLTTGVMDASVAMSNNSSFNEELEGKILCYIDEKDLQKHGHAYNRIKEWVTAAKLLIHGKGVTPYLAPNYTHWIHCANDPKFCPVFPGDTRITMTYVDTLDPTEMIPRQRLHQQLEKEAPNFLHSILALEIPASNDRLRIPVVSTSEKMSAQEGNKDELVSFIEEKCKHVPGSTIKFSDFFDVFQNWLDPQELVHWSKVKVGKTISIPYMKGRLRGTGQHHIGNCAWKADEVEEGVKYILDSEGYLAEVQYD